ncbi:chemotaxis protein MotC [Methylobacterium sp. WSM2598]|uniref:chemotaxis protein MotC n=1 Tax=Methylobacterium sp. WSM2598 TaxID=398261 RepID=UPI000363E686|nr:chemotaxis protein MotC [Methylobacterium sp. WSM2598]
MTGQRVPRALGRPVALALLCGLVLAGAARAEGGGAGGHGDGKAESAAGSGHAASPPAAGGGGGHGGSAATAVVEPLPVAPRSLPVELVRTLQLLQDRIARGGTQAHLAQRQLIAHIEQRLIGLEPETWGKPANVQAAVTFALAGGGPGVLRRVIEAGSLPDSEAPLLQGALAFLEGRERDARTVLTKLDAQTLPASLAGQVALAQSALVVRENPDQALRLLDLARLLAPGTLVEEGALRREVFVLAPAGNIPRFEALSIQYLRRFRHSVYAGNFRQRFAAALTRLRYGDDPVRIGRLEAMLAEIEPEGRGDLYLLVARAAVEQGEMRAAVFAANRAAALVEAGSVRAAQARLYRAAAAIATPDGFDGAYAVLRSLDRAALPSADAGLLDAALSTAAQIRRDLPPAPATPPEEAADGKRPVPQAKTIARAQEAIEQIDDMMRRTRP